MLREVVVTNSDSETGEEKGQPGERERHVVVRCVHVPREYTEMHLWHAGAGAGGVWRGVWDQT